MCLLGRLERGNDDDEMSGDAWLFLHDCRLERFSIHLQTPRLSPVLSGLFVHLWLLSAKRSFVIQAKQTICSMYTDYRMAMRRHSYHHQPSSLLHDGGVLLLPNSPPGQLIQQLLPILRLHILPLLQQPQIVCYISAVKLTSIKACRIDTVSNTKRPCAPSKGVLQTHHSPKTQNNSPPTPQSQNPPT